MGRVDILQKEMERHFDNMNDGPAQRRERLPESSNDSPKTELSRRCQALTEALTRNDIESDDDDFLCQICEGVERTLSRLCASDREIHEQISLLDQARSKFRDRMNRGDSGQSSS